MVRWMRSARIVLGKEKQAIQWSKEITEWWNKKFGGHLTVYMDSFGEIGTIRWFEDYENLAEVEKRKATVLADPEYWQRIDRAVTLFTQTGRLDTVMASL